MKVHRSKHTENFTITPNAIIRDERMGELARLTLIRLLSNADDYEGATALKMWEDARSARGDKAPGKRAYLAAFSELEEFGYLVRTKVREGRKWVTRVDVYDTPQGQDGSEDAQVVGVPGFGKPHDGMPNDEKPASGQSSKRTSEKDASRRTNSSSSVPEAEPEPAPVAEAPAAKKTKKPSPEQIVQERTDATLEEARAVVELVLAQAAADGIQVRVPYRWLEDRDEHVLKQDLAAVQRRSQAPGADVCGLHDVLLERGGGCSSCYGDLKAGDTERVRAHLAEVGADARPDLAAVLGTPQAAAGGSSGEWTWEAQMRAERRARNGYVGGTRGPLPTQEQYAEMAEMSQDQLRDTLFGPDPAQAPKPPHDPRYAAGTGSWVDPDAVYTDDPRVVFGTR